MNNRFKNKKSKYLSSCFYSLNAATHELHQVDKERRDNSHAYEVLEAIHHDIYVFLYDTDMMDSNSILRDLSHEPPLNNGERELLEEMRSLDVEMQHANSLLLDGENPTPYPRVLDSSTDEGNEQDVHAITNIIEYANIHRNKQPNK